MDASAFKKLTHREHVLHRPDMYIGSVTPSPCAAWVIDAEQRMVLRDDLVYSGT